jgi:hypothetical protein
MGDAIRERRMRGWRGGASIGARRVARHQNDAGKAGAGASDRASDMRSEAQTAYFNRRTRH